MLILQAKQQNPLCSLVTGLVKVCAILLCYPLSGIALAQPINTNLSATAVPNEQHGQQFEMPPAEKINPYDPRQLQPLLLDAVLLQEAANHSQALDLLRQAWQVSRINSGLYHRDQLPLLEQMIQSEIELENWEVVEQHYDYMEHLLRRLYEFDDPRLEEGLQKVSSWHVNAFNLNLEGKRKHHLRKARETFLFRLQVAKFTLEADDPKLDFLQNSIAVSEQHLYLMSEQHKYMLQSQQHGERDRLLADLD
jgi:hypothetical protein